MIRYYTAAEIRGIYRRPTGTIYRLASEDGWRRNDDRRRPTLYNGDDVEATMTITDDAFLAAIDEVIRLRSEEEERPWIVGASRWDIAAVLAGHLADVGTTPVDYPTMPEGVVLAKARKLILRGLVDGCACGCRGDFERMARRGDLT